MENNGATSSFFSGCTSDHPLITSGHLSIPGLSSIGSPWQASSALFCTGSPGSPPADPAEMARRKLKRILHLRSPLSSIENVNSLRMVGSTAKVKVGTKEDDVLVMDAVPMQFARGMEEQRSSRLIKPNRSEEEKRAQGPRMPQPSPPMTSTAAVLLREKILQKEEALQAKRDFMWPPTQEEDAIITKVLYGPSDRKRLPVFVKICPN